MHIDFLFEAWLDHQNAAAIIWKDKSYSYGWLSERIGDWQERIIAEKIEPGAVVVIEGDFSPHSVALFPPADQPSVHPCSLNVVGRIIKKSRR